MPKTNYFLGLSSALAQAGHYKPTLIIDQYRLDANINIIKAAVPNGKAIRRVDSLYRLHQYQFLAEKLQNPMRFVFEVDVVVLPPAPHSAKRWLSMGKIPDLTVAA